MGRELIWSVLAVGGVIGAAFLLRGFVDGSLAGDPEGYLLFGLKDRQPISRQSQP